MRGRGQLLAAVLVVGIAVLAGLGLDRAVGVKPPAGPRDPTAPSAAWFCPHGGGRDWTATLEVANPGRDAVAIRVTPLSDGRPGSAARFTVDPGTELRLPADTPSRASATLIEYFGGWVAAAWVSHAGGGEGGVAAEPCAPTAGRSWLLPDGSTVEAAEASAATRQPPTLDTYAVVMNPFATDAIFSISLYADEDAPVHPGDWTNVVLKPFRSRAFYLNEQRLGFGTVSAVVEAKVGRVVASSLNVNQVGGVRASLGQRPPTPVDAVLPGAFDQGRSELVVMNPTPEQIRAAGTVIGRDEPAPITAGAGGRVNPDSAQTFPITTDGPASIVARVPNGGAVVRRTFGKTSDQAATGPGVPARAWVILPAVAGSPSHPGVVVANPGPAPVDVSLSYLMPDGDPAPDAVTMRVPGLRSAPVPSDFVEAAPDGAIVAVARDGTFVPAAASYSLGREGYATYAVALGVPIPDGWVPSAP